MDRLDTVHGAVPMVDVPDPELNVETYEYAFPEANVRHALANPMDMDATRQLLVAVSQRKFLKFALAAEAAKPGSIDEQRLDRATRGHARILMIASGIASHPVYLLPPEEAARRIAKKLGLTSVDDARVFVQRLEDASVTVIENGPPPARPEH